MTNCLMHEIIKPGSSLALSGLSLCVRVHIQLTLVGSVQWLSTYNYLDAWVDEWRCQKRSVQPHLRGLSLSDTLELSIEFSMWINCVHYNYHLSWCLI